MASSGMIGRLMVAGILAGVVLWSVGLSAADPMRLVESLTTGVGVTAAGAYLLFAEGTVTFAGSGFFTATFSDTQAVVTPQPETMVLLGLGLIACAVLPVLRRGARRRGGA